MRPKNNNPNSILSVATKVAIQLSCKIGSAPWWVSVPIKGLITFGFDVCADSRNKKVSYGALVATMVIDGRIEYFSAVSTHKTGEELTNHFAENMRKALLEYIKLANALPQRIVIFRDGVGDGQIRYIQEYEVDLLKKMLGTIYGSRNEEYKMLFMIVSKRINTRLFLENRNPEPGTVVDSVVTLPER